MAKLKGVELKKVVNFRGHEGEPLSQGDLYLNGVKIGFYSDGNFGAPPIIDCSHDDYKKLQELGAEFKLEYSDGAEMLLITLMDLVHMETSFKKAIKGGFMGLAVVKNHSKDGYIMVDDIYKLPKGYAPQQHIQGLIAYRDKLGKVTTENDIKLYVSLDDFIVG